jgi:hypothetical protein
MLTNDQIRQIRVTLEAYLQLFPQVESEAVTGLIMVPYCYSGDGRATELPTKEAFLAFRDAYMVRVAGGARSARLIGLDACPIGVEMALAEVQSARLDASGSEIARARTLFILQKTDSGWLIGAAITGVGKLLEGQTHDV